MEFNAREAHRNRVFQRRQATIARRYAERMSNTSYRRAVRDMRLAGINPILAARTGGASTPSASVPGGGQASAPPPIPMQDVINPAVQSGLSTYQAGNSALQIQSNVNKQKQEVAESETRVKRIKAEIHKIRAATKLNDEQATHVSWMVDEIQQRIWKTQAETIGIKADNVVKTILAEFYNDAGFAAIAKDLGVSPGMLKGIISSYFNQRK